MKRVKGSVRHNMKMLHKLIALFVCMGLIAALSAGYLFRGIGASVFKIQEVKSSCDRLDRIALLIKVDISASRANLQKAAMIGDDTRQFDLARKDYEVARERVINNCDLMIKEGAALSIGSVSKGADVEKGITGVKQGVEAFNAAAGRLLTGRAKQLEGVREGGAGAASLGEERPNPLSLVEMDKTGDALLTGVDELLTKIANLSSDTERELNNVQKGRRFTSVVLLVATLMSAVILGMLAMRHLNRRINVIAEVLNRGANGDLSAKVGSDLGDELGVLGAEFNTMTEKLSGMISKINSSTGELTHISGTLSETSRQVLSAAQTQTDAVSDSSSAMIQMNASIKGVSHGIDSLALSAEESSSSIMEMAASIEEVALNVETLTQSVEEVSSSISQMAASVKQIDVNIISLTDEFANTASSVMEMNESIGQVEKNAKDTAAISEGVRQDAETGKLAVVETIAGIQEIKRSSDITYEVIHTLSEKAEDIGAILSVIDEVAEQTNLLALNAAIIAAQAGERGRGFAVVADEIKELAERTSSSTREIAQVIKAVQDETRRAVEAMDQAGKSITDGEVLSNRSGEALKKIVEGVNRATEQIDEIARATVEQAKGSRMIREAIEKIMEMVGQIAMATCEQGKGGELIISAVERMKDLTNQVRVSTREQTKVGNFIAKSTENITGMIQQIKRASDEQSRGSEQIIVAVENIQHSNTINLDATKVMNNAVMNLSRQIDILRKEMDVFKI